MGTELQLEDNGDDDHPLTNSEMVFFERIVAGEAPAAAYSAAYDVEGWAPGRIYRLAMRLRNSPKIVNALAVAKEAGAHGSNVTLSNHLRELETLRDKAKEANNLAVAVRCEELRGKVAGLYVERVEHSGPLDPIAVLRKMALLPALVPIARELAKANNIPWSSVEQKAIALRSEG
jgi:hypothetical protein